MNKYKGLNSEFKKLKHSAINFAKKNKKFVDLKELKFQMLRTNGYAFKHGSNAIPKSDQEKQELKKRKSEYKKTLKESN